MQPRVGGDPVAEPARCGAVRGGQQRRRCGLAGEGFCPPAEYCGHGELCQVQAGSAGAGCARWLLSDSTLPANTHDFINHLKKTETSESDQVKLDFLGGSPFPPTFVTDFLAGHSLDIPDCDLQLTHSVSRKSQGNCPICSYYVLTLCRLSHDTYGVSESCSECPRKSLPRGDACAHPLALPSGLVPLTLTVLALLPGAAPPVSSQVCVCVIDLHQGCHTGRCRSLSEKTNPLKHDQ